MDDEFRYARIRQNESDRRHNDRRFFRGVFLALAVASTVLVGTLIVLAVRMSDAFITYLGSLSG